MVPRNDRAMPRRANAAFRSLCLASSVVLALSMAVRPAQAETAPAPTDAAVSGAASDETKAAAGKPAESTREVDSRESLCLMIESAARASNLPLLFFARVIWQESRFQPDAVGPVTRNGQRAQGIAQFMPGTARERRLLDPFDPVQALPKSAEFLDELRNQFGNLGLAAAAYNAGPRRVQDWLAGSGEMPAETRNYVFAITGSAVEDWAAARKGGKLPAQASVSTCHELIAILERDPNNFVAQLRNRVARASFKRWGIQVAAGFNRNQALATYARVLKGLSAVLGKEDNAGLAPILLRVHGTSSFYQARIGADGRGEADRLCQRIRRAGGSCLVKRNRA
jgi:Transglycosylase SLT domain/SPOR domain